MSSYFVLLFAMLYFSPVSQLWSVDKKTCSERWKRFFFTQKMTAHCFKQQCQYVRSIIVFWGTPKLLPKSSSSDSKELLKPMLIVFCAGHRKNAGVSFSVSKQSPPPLPQAESCAPALPWKKRHGSLCWVESPGRAEERCLQLLAL